MAGTTITDLESGAITSDSDCFVIDTVDGETVKITYAALIAALQNIFVNQTAYATDMQGKQDTLTFDNRPTPNSNNPVTSDGIGRYISNVIGGVSSLTFLQAYDSSVSQLSAGFVFTPQGAYNMYSNLMNTIPSIAGQIVGSALPSVVTKVLPSQTTDFTIAVSDWVDGRATVAGTFNVSTSYLNDVVPTMGERATWNSCGVYPVAITATDITFECDTTPTEPLTFKVTQTLVDNPTTS